MSRFTTFARARLAVPVVALTVVALTVAACSPPIDSTVSVPGTSPRTPPVRVNVPAVSATELDTMIQRVVREKHMVGLSVGVMQNGAMILAKGYGQRVLSPSEPVTPTTMFPIGSVTKQFTCSAALLLAQDSKLSMQDPVAMYVPTATRAKDITLLDLGQHVSGYRDYYPLDFVVREMQQAEGADTIIGRYATRPLDFEPRTRWSYSNTNFLILGKAIEQASGKRIDAVLSQRIFEPLKMTRTA